MRSASIQIAYVHVHVFISKKYAEEVHVLGCVVLFLFFPRRVANKDKRIAHLEKVTDLKEARTRRTETVS